MAGGTRSYEMARRMVQAGHEVHVVCSDTDPSATKLKVQVIDGITVHWLPVPYDNKFGLTRRLIAFIKFGFQASSYASRIGADIVFASSTPLTIAVPGVRASRKQKIPMVFEVRDLWPEVPIALGALRFPLAKTSARTLEKWAYRNSKRVVALSPGMAEGVRYSGYPAEHIRCIPNSSDTAHFDVPASLGLAFRAKRSWLGDRPLIVYAGTFGKINGVGYLVELAAAMADIDPSVCFLAVGQGAEFDKVGALAHVHGVIGRNFFIEGAIPKSEVPALLSASTVCISLVVPVKELWNNSANKFFDAMAAGRPMAVNHGGWLAEILTENNAGLELDSSNFKTAAAELHAFMTPGRLQAARQAALALAYERFSRDRLAQELIEVLEEAIECTSKNNLERGE